MQGNPQGSNIPYHKGLEEVNQYITNRRELIIKTGKNPDVQLSAEQTEIYNRIIAEDYDTTNLETDIENFYNEPITYRGYSDDESGRVYTDEEFLTAVETDDEEITTEEDGEINTTDKFIDGVLNPNYVEPRSMGPTGQDILKGTVDAAQGILTAFGGPEALINAVMGKKALAAAMKDVTKEEQARLSPMFYEHLREVKELSKQGYHPSEELKIRRGISKAYQQGLDNSIRGTAGDRAKFLANSGILDAKRTSALLEFASQDAALQQENQKQYTALLSYKENFDATQHEAKRTENLQMQLANKKAASEFAGLTFANAMGKMGTNNSALLDLIKQGTIGALDGYNNWNLQNQWDNNSQENNNNNNDNE